MRTWLERVWYEDAPSGAVLRPLSWMFGAAVALRSALYRHGWRRVHRVARPVVIIGNLSVGGTGKTPLVIWLARELTERGLKVGIVSRGYGRTESKPRLVAPDADWRTVGDEPLLLRRGSGCVTTVAADRVAGARQLVEQGVDVIIADDGLQHLRLARNCEIAVIDGTRGFGNGRLLPAGPLREPVSRLRSVDAVVINGSTTAPIEGATARMVFAATQAVPLGAGATPQPLESFAGRRVHAVAGIGNPSRFFRDLRARGLDPIEHPFADHHAFKAADVQFADALPVLMTEKDAVKCAAFANPRLWYVPVTAQFAQADAAMLLERVMSQLNSNPKGQAL